MSYILDAIVILIVLFYVFISAKKGFVRTLIEVVGFVAAIVIAFTVSTPIAEVGYDSFIYPSIAESVEETGKDNINDAADAVWEKLPKFITENSFFGVSKDNVTASAEDEFSNQSDNFAQSISDKMIKPTVVKLLSVIVSFVLVIILLFVAKILAKYVNKLFTFSIIGDINKFLGGALGVVKGAAIAIIFCLVISIILSFTKGGFLIFTYDAINSSYLFKFLMGFSPFI